MANMGAQVATQANGTKGENDVVRVHAGQLGKKGILYGRRYLTLQLWDDFSLMIVSRKSIRNIN